MPVSWYSRLFAVLAGLIAASPSVFGQGFPPAEAAARMTVPDGFSVTTVASEPLIRQPLSISFDARGRLWVLQYLQYPQPAGLKPVKQDRYLRTIWDKVPEPPPHGPKGLDRITILSDRDANGVYTKSKDFVTGLNLASGFCLGGGGVFVVQPPYLLFYPDKNEDDVPDGDPEVRLTGFGLDDTHSVANSLQWGPDGWLYGAAGSTSTCKIKNPAKPDAPVVEFQQGIWRYHPGRREFELFSEGGGNTYGLDFDQHGQVIAGTNHGNKAMLHQVQGAYHIKGFSKHGPLHNPHTYGYFDHVPYTGFKGGHVTCGGVVYQADAFPEKYRNEYIAANLLSNAVYWHELNRDGSTFTAKFGGDLMLANDTWFRGIDLLVGPDGNVYVADWTDKRAAHLDPIDNWDKTNGRVFKLEYQGTPAFPEFDLRKKSGKELVGLLSHPNKWWRNEARRLLGERADASLYPELRSLVKNEEGTLALEALWALYVSGGWDETFARDVVLTHPDEHVRAWDVRLLGDHGGAMVTSATADALVALAESDPSPVVRAQLACTAKRLPAGVGLTVASVLMTHAGDSKDPFIPLLIWWAFEAHIPANLNEVVDRLSARSEAWDTDLGRTILERVARRLVAGDPPQWQAALLLLRGTKSAAEASTVLTGIELALKERPPVIDDLGVLNALRPVRKQYPSPVMSRILVRLGDQTERAAMLATAFDHRATDARQLAAVKLLAEVRSPRLAELLPDLLAAKKSDAFRIGILDALSGIDNSATAERVLAGYPNWSAAVKRRAVTLLTSRPEWALALMNAVDAGTIPKEQLTVDQVRPAVELGDPQVTKLVEKHWGQVGPATPGEKLARINYLNLIINRQGLGDPAKGKALFAKNCAACHQLFGEGGKIGPDLTTADRKNRGYLLAQVVDPSGFVRPEYVSYKVDTLDGRTLTGLAKEVGGAVTLTNVIDNKEQITVIPKADIDDMRPSPVSLMPEKLFDGISNDDVRDLMAYLMADPPAAAPKPKAESKVTTADPKAAKTLKVVLVSGSLEYESDTSLIAFQKHLEANYPVECVRAFRKSDDDIPGLDALKTADVAVFFTRRLKIDGKQLDAVKEYVASGKPVVGIRTASHGFQNWLEMDKLVFGGDYQGHFAKGFGCTVEPAAAAKDHPVLIGISSFTSKGSLYKNPKPAADITVLLTGSILGQAEPVAWVRERKAGGKTQRVFYTSLGFSDDFADPVFTRLLTNGLYWTVGRAVPKSGK